MARELLEGLETRDLALIETRLRLLRETLAVRHCMTEVTLDPGAFLWLERLDLLEGIAESVDASVEAIRQSSKPHLLRMQTAENLLRHLVGGGSVSWQSPLPVC
jgi:hypothetical protein